LRHQIFPRRIRTRPAPNGWGSGIIEIVLGFRPTFIAAVVDWTGLAMLINVETAKKSGQEEEGDHD
jgi:hypothetical protein